MDSIPQTLWAARVPLHVTHPSHPNTPLVVSLPRFSYLALLLPRCSAFFRSPVSAFHHEDLLLRNLPLGLLVDLYQPPLPWRLTVSDGLSWDIFDTFLNCVKEVSQSCLSCPHPNLAYTSCVHPLSGYVSLLSFSHSHHVFHTLIVSHSLICVSRTKPPDDTKISPSPALAKMSQQPDICFYKPATQSSHIELQSPEHFRRSR